MEKKQDSKFGAPPFGAEHFPTIFATLSTARQQRFVSALDSVNAGLAAKQIPNPVFKDAKDFLNRVVYDSYRALISEPYFYAGKWESLPEEVRRLTDNIVSSLHDCKSASKKYAKAKSTGAAIDAMRAYMAEIEPLVMAFDDLKGMIVKRVVLSAEEREELNRFVPPPADAGVKRVVFEALEAITKQHYEELVKLYKKRNDNYVKRFLEADEETRKEMRRFGDINVALGVAVQRVGLRGDVYELLPDADQKLQQLAIKDARFVQESFISKNLRKLASIADQKGDFEKVEAVESTVSLEGLRGRLNVSFKDGARFAAENSVVWSHSVYGKPFLRFPLTFHEVYFADGTRMPGPSEEKMNTLFCKVPEASPLDMARDAAGRFADGEPGAISPDEAQWTINEHYPLSKLGNLQDLKDRFIQQCAQAEEDGQGNLYEALIGHPIEKPIVILTRQGKPFVWDGEVRVGAAARNGQETIRAVVGVPLSELTLEKNLSAKPGKDDLANDL